MNDPQYVQLKDDAGKLTILRIDCIQGIYFDNKDNAWSISLSDENCDYRIGEGSAERLIAYLAPRTIDLSVPTLTNESWK